MSDKTPSQNAPRVYSLGFVIAATARAFVCGVFGGVGLCAGVLHYSRTDPSDPRPGFGPPVGPGAPVQPGFGPPVGPPPAERPVGNPPLAPGKNPPLPPPPVVPN